MERPMACHGRKFPISRRATRRRTERRAHRGGEPGTTAPTQLRSKESAGDSGNPADFGTRQAVRSTKWTCSAIVQHFESLGREAGGLGQRPGGSEQKGNAKPDEQKEGEER